MSEHVDHPAHYTIGGIEAIDVIEAWELDFHLGNTCEVHRTRRPQRPSETPRGPREGALVPQPPHSAVEGRYMNEWQKKVRDFHQALDQPIGERPGEIPEERKWLREDLIAEEADELLDAMGHATFARSDLPKVADALVDLIYVTLGTAVEYGIDLDPIFDAVHEANMKKVGGPVREDGKVLKPDDWKPADLAALVEQQKGEP